MIAARVAADVRTHRVSLLTSISPPFIKKRDLLAPKLGRPNSDTKGKGRDNVRFGIGLPMQWVSRWRLREEKRSNQCWWNNGSGPSRPGPGGSPEDGERRHDGTSGVSRLRPVGSPEDGEQRHSPCGPDEQENK